MPALELKNIKKSYGRHDILQEINLQVAQKEFLILVGPSGCGKSTLLNMIAGLEETKHGEIMMNGKNVTATAPKDRNIAMVFQSYALYPNMTVKENISFGLKMRKFSQSEIDEKVKQVAGILQLESLLDRKPSQLSGGQRQRVAMGRAIARSPHLYLFDEPLSNLDAQLRAVMRKEIKKLHAQIQCAVVYVTHDQQEAMTLGDRIAVMNEGKIVQLGTPDEIYSAPKNMFVAGFIGSPAMNFIPCTVAKDKGEPVFEFSNHASKVMVKAPSYLSAWAGKTITLGIRPEYFEISKSPSSDSISVLVTLVENTGSDIFVYFTLNGQEVVARTKHVSIEKGETIYTHIHQERCCYFNPATTERICP